VGSVDGVSESMTDEEVLMILQVDIEKLRKDKLETTAAN
jgi:hypothetical protein